MAGKVELTFTGLLRNPLHLVAFGFGAGLSPKAPGTFGTIVAIPLYLLICGLSLPWYIGVIIISGIAGIFICDRTAHDIGIHDHSGIVWDEIVGYFVALIAIPVTWWNILLAFLLFRLFDVIKPWPIGWLDRKVQGGVGIMIDDIIAGFMAWAVLYVLNVAVLN